MFFVFVSDGVGDVDDLHIVRQQLFCGKIQFVFDKALSCRFIEVPPEHFVDGGMRVSRMPDDVFQAFGHIFGPLQLVKEVGQWGGRFCGGVWTAHKAR